MRVRARLRFCLRCCTRTEGENEQPDIRERSIRWWGRGRDDPFAYLVLSGPYAPARTDKRTAHSLTLTQARAPSESRAKSAVVKRRSGHVRKRVKSTGSSGAAERAGSAPVRVQQALVQQEGAAASLS